MCCHSTHPALRQAREWENIGCPITKFCEEAHQRLGGLIGPNHEPLTCASERILSNHALASFDVAEMKIFSHGIEQVVCLIRDGTHHGVCGNLYIDGQGSVGLDNVKGFLRICFVSLRSIR
ncbi:hypothetical protein AGR4C_pb30028 [Agrobacterium tumefaciens str. Kerr 14]|uniref:Uncharacterized protein n=1 Tax=Agrobacterium tumefaciens str. Kerr 14 TaxID=1183424 RepID=A0A1S7SEQ3_AGRTU|nr:hypothetical protein AGR4C_pb30028 [Agrobacterium tumefaciens str. Kerr 14]